MATRSRYNAGNLEFFDNISHERVMPLAAVLFEVDFLGAGYQAVPAAGSATAGAEFVKKIVGAAPPTVAGVANGAGGQVACTLTSTSEKQDAMLYTDDNKGFDATKGLVIESRIQLSVLPSAAGVQAVWGACSSWIDGPDNNTCYLEFGATANGAILCRMFDGTTTKSLASGVTVLTTEWHTYRIDATNVNDVAFYIDGARVNAVGSVVFAATGTLAVLQPVVQAYKPSGTGVATVTCDFLRLWANR